jgi:hypothetical protein
VQTRPDLTPGAAATRRGGWDLFAAVAVVLAGLVAAFYLAMAVQGEGIDVPTAWVVIVLLLAMVLGGYGAQRTAARRRPALVACAVILLAMGVATVMSVGLVLIGAAALAGIAATRT